MDSGYIECCIAITIFVSSICGAESMMFSSANYNCKQYSPGTYPSLDYSFCNSLNNPSETKCATESNEILYERFNINYCIECPNNFIAEGNLCSYCRSSVTAGANECPCANIKVGEYCVTNGIGWEYIFSEQPF